MTEADDVAARTSELVSLPRAWHRISEMLDDDRYGAADMASVVAADPGLTARLLRLVNSPFYGLPRRVDTVSLAVSILGARALHNVVLTTSVASAFDRIDTRLVDVADFWHHSVYCGLMARLLSQRLQRGDAEQAFTGGLLHDIGKLAIYQIRPEAASEILRRLADNEAEQPLTFRDLELEILGFDHATVGAALLRQWHLPTVYRDIVGYHHTPGEAPASDDEVCLVHAANALSKKVEPGHKLTTDEADLPVIDPAAAERIPLEPDMVAELRMETDVRSIEVYGTLFGN
ncbi:HDOD domain-containing protein [Arhodomonas sp. AD133]|uniref:HDOD domain-containing protein n=1 Tax=Arhodomonas sp. AD133 TaxID=3415009 RepID=UPI003EBFD22D